MLPFRCCRADAGCRFGHYDMPDTLCHAIMPVDFRVIDVDLRYFFDDDIIDTILRH